MQEKIPKKTAKFAFKMCNKVFFIMPNKVKNDFPTYPRPDVLYHASTRHVTDWLMPRPNKTCTQQQNGEFVFAGSDKNAAYLYSIKTADCLETGGIRNGHAFIGSYVLFQKRDAFYEINPKGYIYPLDPGHFVPVPGRDGISYTGEWISYQPVPVDPEKTIRVNGIEEVMAHGHEVFFLARSRTKEEEFLMREAPDIRTLAQLINSGLLIWENQVRSINPLLQLVDLVEPHHHHSAGNYCLPPPG